MADCVFCKIGAREIPAMVVYEDADIIAFRDIHPQAPAHILIITKRHAASLDEYATEDAALLGRLILAARQIARQEKLADRGYRIVVNCGEDGGQAVAHIHLHLLGGRPMNWPPG
ncbi:MAG: histidine triad nucleotide-binding protein [Planctomycetota bacterium]|nr:histidine triad nucleotide-binding protein [Planctomycetota bacterium]